MVQYTPAFGFSIGVEPNKKTRDLLGLDPGQPLPENVEFTDDQLDVVVYMAFTATSRPSIVAPDAKPRQAILSLGNEVMRMPKTEADARAMQAFGGG